MSQREIASLIQDRKRYLAYTFAVTGMPMTTTYDQPQGIIQDATAAAAVYQTSTKTQKVSTTFATYQTAGSMAPMNDPLSTVRCHLFTVRNLIIDLFSSAARLAMDRAVTLTTVQSVMPKPSTNGLAKLSTSR
jgi:hypothetical protein